MSGKVWISSVFSNYEIGNKAGIRAKFFDQEWDPAKETHPIASTEHIVNLNRYSQGFALLRDAFPEAIAVYNEMQFLKTGQLLISRGYFVVKNKLAEVLSRFDLGEGALIPLTIYKADLVTPIDAPFWLLNFGARKDSFLPDKCEDAQPFLVLKDTGQQIWKINYFKANGQVALSPKALQGADLWVEVAAYNKLFMSGDLVEGLQEAGLATDWRLQQCHIVGLGGYSDRVTVTVH